MSLAIVNILIRGISFAREAYNKKTEGNSTSEEIDFGKSCKGSWLYKGILITNRKLDPPSTYLYSFTNIKCAWHRRH